MTHENTTSDTQTEDELIRELYENSAIEQALKQSGTPAWCRALCSAAVAISVRGLTSEIEADGLALMGGWWV